MTSDAKEWIVSWFEKHAIENVDEIRQHTADNYFDKGWIDSLAFVTFIAELERRFDVRFSNSEFQARHFATIDGLTEIVETKLHEDK